MTRTRTRPTAGLLLGAAALLALLPATATAADSGDLGGRSGPTGRLLVTVRTAEGHTTRAVEARLADVARRAGVRAAGTDPAAGTAAVEAGDAAARARVAAELRRDPRVVEVVPERRAALRGLPNDASLHQQDPGAPAGVLAGWWIQRMNIPAAWSLANGNGIKIAVIDSGVDGGHPQLSPVIDQAQTDGPVVGTARTDEVGHGTHVASLACSAFNDGAGLAGAGGRCHLIVIKSELRDSSVASSIDRAVAAGADAIVMSFGVDGVPSAPTIIREALQRAVDKGVVPVAAAADSATTEQGYPANTLQPTGSGPRIDSGLGLTVTAAQADGARASFAGYGSQISVAAYGTYTAGGAPGGLLGAFPGQTTAFEQASTNPDGSVNPPCECRVAFGGDSRYAHLQGTSMAAPIVAGVVGLVRDANPDLPAASIVRLIKQTATRGGGYSDQLGWGIVDAGAAVDQARRIDLRAPKATLRNRSRRTTAARLRLSWRASDAAPKPLVASGVKTVEVYRSVRGGSFRRVGSAKRGRLTVSIPHGTTRFALRPVDKAGNRAPRPTKGALTIRR
ncbi:S8 family peptidase [Patulibacter defluvii]|uniref:S8 family peptidase n=1 Tax=Patulibacter defluvii TaxID=3095358 RepID=UPI002A75A1D9|nr:S8 family serine peptidase [Patulibacter sp. DM4]